MQGVAVVRAAGVTKVHTGGVEALRGVDVAFDAGESAAIVGPSGSGKSTLLSVLGTLERPTSGCVHVGDTATSTVDDRELAGLRGRDIGFVFQQFHLVRHLNARQNVEQAMLYLGERPGRRRESALEALDRVGLAHRATHRPTELSGGEQQRVAIARAIVKRPRLVLADEPTGNLDSATARDIVALLAGLTREGTTLVVVTHDRDLAAAHPRRIHMRDGLVERDER